nr:MAG TPA_asm: hypothetical protein [Caudoviricetes sp.]
MRPPSGAGIQTACHPHPVLPRRRGHRPVLFSDSWIHRSTRRVQRRSHFRMPWLFLLRLFALNDSVLRSQCFRRGFPCPDTDFPRLRFTGLANTAVHRGGQTVRRQDDVCAIGRRHICGSDVVTHGVFLPRFILHPAVRLDRDGYRGQPVNLCPVHFLHCFQRCIGQLTCQTCRILLCFLCYQFQVGYECDNIHSRLSSLKKQARPPCDGLAPHTSLVRSVSLCAENLGQHSGHILVGCNSAMDHVGRLSVHGGVHAVDVDMTVGLAGGGLGGTSRNALQLFALGIGHQTLAGLSGHEVGRLLAGIGQVAACIQSGEVASGGVLHLVGLAADVHIQAVCLEAQSITGSSRDVHLYLDLITRDSDGGGSILAGGLGLVGIDQSGHIEEAVGAAVRVLALHSQHHDGLTCQLGVGSIGVGLSAECKLRHKGGLDLIEEQLLREVEGECGIAGLVGAGVEADGVAGNAKRLNGLGNVGVDVVDLSLGLCGQSLQSSQTDESSCIVSHSKIPLSYLFMIKYPAAQTSRTAGRLQIVHYSPKTSVSISFASSSEAMVTAAAPSGARSPFAFWITYGVAVPFTTTDSIWPT